MKPKDQALDVWGDFACFSRPELKVERFSYPVPTPSAVRGIYDAIYCKPTEFRWQVTRIEILNPPAYIALRRNEVKDKAPSERTILRWMDGKDDPQPILADCTDDPNKGRTQRQTMALKDVRYRLHAEIRPWSGFESRLQGMENQFRRRAAKGKCIYQPYFGCREFPAYFELVDVDAPPAEPISLTKDLGLMLYDVFDLSRPGKNDDKPSISLFRTKVENGILDVPHYESDAVLKMDWKEV
ncbi:type I-C CRISPR-associated protein Cas5 [candidate division TA06 bacterium B3_TA06]|uniref:pre-crRNA processing endonuclease n=1 Tax=candidate division TA06 bacterium B3_TA06 TaxID=2012487 RepID=A0A532V175_UNCT6|nr:MAG: type I-C CRISPR-associated protein Cas5 [candidate division TA06 bacterium B3_TA06]